MYTALEIFIIVFLLCLSAVVLAGTFTLIQLAIERFIGITLPILAELYGRIRYPYEFKDK